MSKLEKAITIAIGLIAWIFLCYIWWVAVMKMIILYGE